jgi:hypothetical protein
MVSSSLEAVCYAGSAGMPHGMLRSAYQYTSELDAVTAATQADAVTAGCHSSTKQLFSCDTAAALQVIVLHAAVA